MALKKIHWQNCRLTTKMLVSTVSRGLCLRMESGLSHSGKNFCAVMGKAGNFILSQGKLIFFENHYTTDERLEKAFQVICDWSQQCHYLIKKSFEQVENVLVLKIKWVEKQPGGRYHIYHFGLHLVWQGNGNFFIREFEKLCRSVTTKFKGRHTLGDMLLGNEVGTCCRNSLYDPLPVFRKRFGFAFVISLLFYKDDIFL